MNYEDVSRKARAAIFELRGMAREGNREAIAELNSIGVHIAHDLAFMRVWPPEAAVAVAESSAQSDEWVVSIPSIHELRKEAIERQIPANLGDKLTIRPTPTSGSGGTRYFDPNTKGGFTYQIWKFFDACYGINHFPSPPARFSDFMTGAFLDDAFLNGWRPEDFTGWILESQREMLSVTEKAMALPILTIESLPQWIALGMEWADAICIGRWEEYPWPQKILDRAKTKTSQFAKSPRGCKTVVKGWISDGLKSMIAAA